MFSVARQAKPYGELLHCARHLGKVRYFLDEQIRFGADYGLPISTVLSYYSSLQCFYKHLTRNCSSRKSVGEASKELKIAAVPSYDSAFLLLTPA